MRVLLLDQEPSETDVAAILRPAGFTIEVASSEESLLALAPCVGWAAIVVNVASTSLDDVDVVRRVRGIGLDMPVLMISDASEPKARVAGLGAGADDYLSNPYDRNELVARLEAIIRRSRRGRQTVLKVGSLLLNQGSHEVTVGNSPVLLTIKEFEVLHLLMMRKGTTLTKTAILDHLYQNADQPEPKIIDVFICKLRKKLSQAGADNLIGTVWGQGYTLQEPNGGGQYHISPKQAARSHTLEAAA